MIMCSLCAAQNYFLGSTHHIDLPYHLNLKKEVKQNNVIGNKIRSLLLFIYD